MAEENNIGASRLLGTNGLQQAVDSLTTQVNKMGSDIGKLVSSIEGLTGSYNRSTGSSSAASGWNAGSNRNRYNSNGGGSRFTSTGTQAGRGSNGGSTRFGSLGSGSRLSAGMGAALGVASAAANFGNQNMAGAFQQGFFGSQAALAGGGTAGNNVATNSAFANNYAALNINDAAQAGYINAYTFGNPVFNGVSNPSFASGTAQTKAFGYLSPSMGATAAATAAQQTYSARSIVMAQALGLASPILPNGQQNSMSNIANSIMKRSFGNKQPTAAQFNAAIQQNGGLNVNLQYFGQQLGWNQSTIQEYTNYLQGQNTARLNGISSSQYATLTQQAANGNANAQNKLKSVGIGTSSFEAQRNLNSTQMTRQTDINQTMNDAFTATTDVVNKFSQVLTALMKTTGLDKLIGGAAGTASPISNALGGFSNAFGAGTGILGALKLFGGGGGLTGLFNKAAGAGGMTAASAGGSGAFNITTAAAGGGVLAKALPGLGTLGAATLAGQTTQSSLAKGMNKSGADTSTFESYMLTHYANSTAANRAAGAKAWFVSHPGASVDPKYAALFGYTPPVTTGVGGGGSLASQGNSLGNGSSNVGANAASVIKAAETQLGVPYVYGGESPGKGMDCSGLTQWAYGQAGVKIPRVASDQQSSATAVNKNSTQPGDLLFVGNPAHHVVMSIGGGQIIEAPHTGENVRIRALNPGEFDSAGRYVGSVGNMSSLINGQGSSSTLSTAQSRSGGDIGSLGGTSEAAVVMAALAGGMGGGSVPISSQSGSAAGTGASGSPTGSTPTGNGLSDKGSLQAYAKQLLAKYGWSGQWNSFNALEMSEAGWDVSATNPGSGAYGLPQALPASKLSSAGADWKTNGDTQLNWMMDYIKGRYGSPDAAWSFHQKNNWYASGAWSIDKDQNAVVHQGEMIIPAQQAETIRQTLLNNSFNPNNKSSSTGSINFGGITVNLPSTYSGSSQDAQNIGKAIADATAEQLRMTNLQIGQ